MRARIIRAYIAKPKNIPLISLISQCTRPRDKRDKRVIFPLNSYIYARARGLLTRLYAVVGFYSANFSVLAPSVNTYTWPFGSAIFLLPPSMTVLTTC